MLNRLRWRLTLLYLLAALLLVVLVGAGAYQLLRRSLLQVADRALEYRLNVELASIGEPPPGGSAALLPAGQETGIYVYPLSRQGTILFDPNLFAPPTPPDWDAGRAALQNGRDLRTLWTADGLPVRLLTYRLARSDEFALLQLGYPLSDQQTLLTDFITGQALLAAALILVTGVASWWLAGRDIHASQRAIEQQRTFVANASHELRAPLTLIRAGIEVAQRSLADVPARRLLSAALTDVDYMNRLIEDLLLLSRLDEQRLTFDLQALPLPAFLAEMRQQVQQLAAGKTVQFCDDPPAGAVLADGDRLRQVFLILLDNALRNLPDGGQICFSVAPQGGWLVVQVSDDGPGIPQEHLAHVFDRFYSVPGRKGAGGASTGLGLAIARRLVEGMGGQIWIESEQGKGTCVSLRLRAAPGGKQG